MKYSLFILFVAAVGGCTTNKAVVPSLDGKPRVQINKQIPAPAAAPALTNATKEE